MNQRRYYHESPRSIHGTILAVLGIERVLEAVRLITCTLSIRIAPQTVTATFQRLKSPLFVQILNAIEPGCCIPQHFAVWAKNTGPGANLGRFRAHTPDPLP